MAKRGFTIIELVVAIIIAAIISGAVASSLSQLGRARDISRIRMTASRRATDALESIRRDVQSTLRSDDLFDTRLRLSPEVARLSIGEVDRDQMLLFALRLRPIRSIEYSGEGAEYETQYRIEEDRFGTALWRRRDATPDEFEDSGGIAESVGDGVVGVRFEAYDGQAWVQEWDSDVDGLPMSIRATVTASGVRPGEDAFADPRSLSVMRTEIPIDRVAKPKLDEATLLAQAEAEAAAAGASGGENGTASGAGDTTNGGATESGGGQGGGATDGGGGKGGGATDGGGGRGGGKGGGRGGMNTIDANRAPGTSGTSGRGNRGGGGGP